MKFTGAFFLTILLLLFGNVANASWYTGKTGVLTRAYVSLQNLDPNRRSIQLEIKTPQNIYFACNAGSDLDVKNPSASVYDVSISGKGAKPPAMSASESVNNLCYFGFVMEHIKAGNYHSHYEFTSFGGNITIQGLYEGSIVAKGTLYIGYFSTGAPIWYDPNHDQLASNTTAVCRSRIMSRIAVLYLASPIASTCVGGSTNTHGACTDATSVVGGQYTMKISQRLGLNQVGKQCDTNKTPFTLVPELAVVQINPVGLSQIDADTSYVEVLNETGNTIYWGYSDLYNYFANGQAFDTITASQKVSAFQPVAAGQSGYLNVHKTDTFSVGIQAGHNLLTLYKHWDPDPTHNRYGKFYWSVLTADLMSNNATGSAQSDEGFALIPEMMDEDGRPIAVCTNVKPDKPIDLIDGKTLLITVYDPTSFQKPSTCYSADVSQGFNASGYNAGGV